MFPTRRDFVVAAAATATTGLIWSDQRRPALAQEAPPETTKVTLAKTPSLCHICLLYTSDAADE